MEAQTLLATSEENAIKGHRPDYLSQSTPTPGPGSSRSHLRAHLQGFVCRSSPTRVSFIPHTYQELFITGTDMADLAT